jgi:diguanylate cyclase (GGDEF)-like protein/PAS domain S-box-containing protein
LTRGLNSAGFFADDSDVLDLDGSGPLLDRSSVALAVLQALPHTAITVLDRDLRYLLASGGILTDNGYDPELLEGRLATDVVPRERWMLYDPLVRAALDGESASGTHLSEDRTRSYQVHAHPLRDDTGAVIAAAVVCVDTTDLRRGERERLTAVRESQIGFETGAIGALRIGTDGRILDVNEPFAAFAGRPREEIVGLTTIELAHPGDVASILSAFGRLVGGTDSSWEGEYRLVQGNGQVAYTLVSGVLVDDDAGRPMHALVHVVDITERKRTERELSRAETDLKRAFEHAPVGMALVDLGGRITRVNRALTDITGHTEAELLERRLVDLVHPDDVGADREHTRQLIDGEIREYELDERLRNAHGHTIWVSVSASMVRDADGRPLHLVVQFIDISARKLAEERLRRLADYDPLTQVHNRRRFSQDLEFQIRRCRRYGEQAALVVLDVNDLKQVNDTYGHRVGDALLKTVAGVLRTRARQADSVARLGGDEFGMLLIHVGSAQAAAVVEELRRLVAEASIALPDGGTLSCSVSAGLALLDEGAGGNDEILAEADRAMYADKRARHRP